MFKQRKLGSEQVVSIVICVFIVAALILKLFDMFNVPTHWDTSLYTNIAVGYFDRGILTPLMWRLNPEWNIVTGSGSGYGIFLLFAWFKVFGLSIFSGQVLMYILALLNVPIIYLLGKHFYNSHEAGLWAAGFFALSGTFAGIVYVRMDTPTFLTCSLILLLHLEAVKRNKLWLHFAVGMALVLALEVHVLSALYAGGVALYHAYYYFQSVWREKRIILHAPAIAFGVGLVLAAAVYFFIHIAPNPDIYFEIPRNCVICTPRSVAKEVFRWVYWAQDLFPPLMLFFGFALISAFVRHTDSDRNYLLIFTGALLTLWVLNPPIHAHYTGQLLVLVSLGVGGLYAQGLDGKKAGLRSLTIIGVVILTATLIARTTLTYFTPANAYNGIDALQYPANSIMSKDQYRSAIDYVRSTIPADTVVLGPESFFADLFNYRQFLSYYGGELYGVWIRNETLFDLWQREHPQVFIGDPQPDAELWRYMGNGSGFVEVHPKVWVEKPLAARLASSTQQANSGKMGSK